MWNGLPVIRKEIAVSMINDYGLNQRQTAEKLDITPAAVCQYLSKKRGRPHIFNEKILYEIKLSAKKIIDNGDRSIIPETCRICTLINKSTEHGLFCKI
jgi:predicted transcriptional regulator